MPTQSLDHAPEFAFAPSSARTTLARLTAFGGAALLTVYGYLQMTMVFGNEFRSVLEWLLLILFTITFAWVALSATQAIAGLFSRSSDHRAPRHAPLKGRTAILMPVYQEDPGEVCAALYAMGKGLAELGHSGKVEIFILSDTRDPHVWVQETAAFSWLREALSGQLAVWYRRRKHNTGRKAGNLREFVERWGARYDYMLVLDADSLIAPATIVELIRRMDAAPRLGILQTVPMLTGATTLFGRLQQYAGRLYGKVIAKGVDAWQGLDGNYWGHNALIRVAAFAAHGGLPELPGRKPFGGHVLSHDFVEAALIRRGGWDVRMDPDLDGSWEGSPPSLLDLATRDRRWAQGNLQHISVLGARGLRLPNRIHFLMGIGAYLMSPIWLALLVVGAALTAQTLFVDPQYFADTLQLFPHWPVFDAARMAWLFALALGLLLLPKTIGLVHALVVGRVRRKLGGPLRIVPSALLEVLLSALYAPILMFLQVRHVFEILSGRDSGWSAQRREGGELPWGAAFAQHWGHMLYGIVPLLVIGWWVPEQLVWVAPVIMGLILAPFLSRISGSDILGTALRRVGLLAIPEELSPPWALLAMKAARPAATAASRISILEVVRDPARLAAHCATLELTPPAAMTEVEVLAVITARAKIDAAANAEQALGWMTREERQTVVGSPHLLARLSQVATQPPQSPNAPCLDPAAAASAADQRALGFARASANGGDGPGASP